MDRRAQARHRQERDAMQHVAHAGLGRSVHAGFEPSPGRKS